MKTKTKRLVPMAFVASVPRSIEFYEHLGFELVNTFTPPDATEPAWAYLESDGASLMVSKASDPVNPEQQAVLFYLYTDDVVAMRDTLISSGLQPGPIKTPFYMPKGEFRLADPDGYVLMIANV